MSELWVLSGTPVDRYYLNKFLDRIRPLVAGETLEIGGSSANREMYRFSKTTSYQSMDAALQSAADVKADAHYPKTWKRAQFHTILAFNVLEHCRRPWNVIENIHRWLISGGRFFGVVPIAQRVHNDPKDYWRIMPDALSALFEDFDSVEVATFGNLKSCFASLAGISAEEISVEELDEVDPYYPVVACVYAVK